MRQVEKDGESSILKFTIIYIYIFALKPTKNYKVNSFFIRKKKKEKREMYMGGN